MAINFPAYLCSTNEHGCRETTEKIYGPNVSPLCGECEACVLCCDCGIEYPEVTAYFAANPTA